MADATVCYAPIELRILNLETKEVFNKPFQSAYLARKFLSKAKRSKKIKVVGVFGNLG